MKVLVACEYSGVVRDEFTANGHDAISCDVLPSESPGPHHCGDIREFLPVHKWDLIIAHPPYTYLCNSGVRWLYNKDGSKNADRWDQMEAARQFFEGFLTYPCDRICIENPIPHKHAKLPRYNQIVQPWQFGHGETKATCLWLKGLPELKPTDIVEGREARIHKMAPSEDRGKLRSKTYIGFAKAMAEQWETNQ